MIKVKMIELLNINMILSKLCSFDNKDVSVGFNYKIGILHERFKIHVNQYTKCLQEIITKNDIKIIENNFVNEDEGKLNNFLKSKIELENLDLEIEQSKIIFDRNAKGLNSYELLMLRPFFDFSELN